MSAPNAGRAPLTTITLVLFAVGVAGIAWLVSTDPRRAVFAWLAAYAFGLSTCLVALVVAMIFHVTRAVWPVILRPVVMGIAGATPVFALLFLPVAIARIFADGARPDAAHLDFTRASNATELGAHAALWLASPFFLARAVLYLVAWTALTFALVRADARYDEAPSEENADAQRRISAAGLPILGFTMTFASFDWFMATTPNWSSTVYGLYFFAGGFAAATSLVAVSTWYVDRTKRDSTSSFARPDHFHAVGRLMLTATIFWAYLAFFQYLLLWIANLPRERGFFLARREEGWASFGGCLLVGHFLIPFLLLLSRSLKFRSGAVALVGVWLLLMHAVDVAWLVLASLPGGPHVVDFTAFLAVNAIAVLYGLRRYRTRTSPQPPRDPSWRASLGYRAP